MAKVARLTNDDIAADDAARLRDGLDGPSLLTVGGVTVEVSGHALAVLTTVLQQLAAGRSIDVLEVGNMLTTQEAADRLRVSRPTLVKMLEDGLLPYDQPGVHRRVPRAAVEEFITSRRHRRGPALDRMGEDSDTYAADEIVPTR